jgi:hypothetical protein
MNRWYTKLSAVSALMLALTIWGCESVTDGALTGPSEASEILVTSTNSGGYTVARETDPTVGVVSAVIGQSGGALNLGKHFLTVPAGAVDGPTTFTVTKLSGELKVELTASRLLPNDVGSAGFRVPVKLGVSYESASAVPDASQLKVVWVKPDGTMEVQQSNVDVYGKVVVGSLNHFSAYAVVIPE